MVCGRISFTLGLKGPSLSIDTACSSSLVGAHVSATSFLSPECPRSGFVTHKNRAETASYICCMTGAHMRQLVVLHCRVGRHAAEGCTQSSSVLKTVARSLKVQPCLSASICVCSRHLQGAGRGRQLDDACRDDGGAVKGGHAFG